MIWSYLTYPADRLILALTCKSHMAVFQELRGNTQKSVRTKKSAKDAAIPSSTSKAIPPKRAPSKFDRLHILIRLESWMPKQYKLCCECLRYVPRKQASRKGLPAAPGNDSWPSQSIEPLQSINEKEIAKKLKEISRLGPRCPDCWTRASLEIAAAKTQHKELKKELAKLM